jgi:hypothetical protein
MASEEYSAAREFRKHEWNSLMESYNQFDRWRYLTLFILRSPNYVESIKAFLEEDKLEGKLKLLYRGTRDGLNSNSFLTKAYGHFRDT